MYLDKSFHRPCFVFIPLAALCYFSRNNPILLCPDLTFTD
ncbi:unnamed protein product [Brassica oleracea]|uniref:(rape) hypothetical protein n=1 Tax=Brassica napus TaxID=3708 RepID=A0A816ID32_BRANA|nr:unnamed protein product [Brassica napus]